MVALVRARGPGPEPGAGVVSGGRLGAGGSAGRREGDVGQGETPEILYEKKTNVVGNCGGGPGTAAERPRGAGTLGKTLKNTKKD